MAIPVRREPIRPRAGGDRDQCHRLRCYAAIQRVYPYQ